ncbi:MAG TPA: methenyltetrahydromethanopterin cyclohydrolase [Candidatus Thorarchaeota archaeon]|nr:MAG: methenyltetrahydromethanopterin cyclohydrolase [Candidatus Thorarchaeota archaeon]HDD66995.1 methenyltetrahydromethanopterin cyclohydrolase [Candidatus Thorarchaeota archaeon]
MMDSISVNRQAMGIVEDIIDRSERLGCVVRELANGTTIIDAGVECEGSMELGRLVGEVCLGGLGVVRLTEMHVEDLTLPAVVVSTRNPAIATLGSQYAGWSLKVDDFSAMASGPARALARVESRLFEELDYEDTYERGVIVLETSMIPSEAVTGTIAEKCGISASDLYCVVVPTASIAGSVQIASRIVEVAVHKLHVLGFSPSKIRSGQGVAPVAPVAKNDMRAMGVTNDCILYGGRVVLSVLPDETDNLAELVKKCPASASEQYGLPFYDLFKLKGFDFYKVDPLLFSPAEITLVNITSQAGHKAGALNVEVLKHSLESCS